MEVKVNESNLHWRAARSFISWATMAFQLGSPSMEAILDALLGLVEVERRGKEDEVWGRGACLYTAPRTLRRVSTCSLKVTS
jgi:hypothetical protein